MTSCAEEGVDAAAAEIAVAATMAIASFIVTDISFGLDELENSAHDVPFQKNIKTFSQGPVARAVRRSDQAAQALPQVVVLPLGVHLFDQRLFVAAQTFVVGEGFADLALSLAQGFERGHRFFEL